MEGRHGSDLVHRGVRETCPEGSKKSREYAIHLSTGHETKSKDHPSLAALACLATWLERAAKRKKINAATKNPIVSLRNPVIWDGQLPRSEYGPVPR